MGRSKCSKNRCVKVVRLRITQPLIPTTSWESFNSIMKQLHEETRLASNHVITLCNFWYSNSVYVDDVDEKEKSKLAYATAKKYAPSLQSYNVSSISDQNLHKYYDNKNGYVKKMEEGTGNPPMSFQKDISIPIARYQCFHFEKLKNGFYNFSFPLVSSEFKEKWNNENIGDEYPDNLKMKNGLFKVGIDCTCASVKSVVEKCMSGDYSVHGSQIVKKKQHYYIHLTYSFAKPVNTELDPIRKVGVDLGVNTAAVCGVNFNDYTRKYIGGKSILDQRLKYQRLLTEEQRKATVTTKNGHGRTSKIVVSSSIRHKRKNYNETINRKIAKEIVDFALANRCGTIQMEDLSGFRQKYCDDKYLGQWVYYQLQQFVEELAKQKGISVKYVEPAYTSQTCSKCGCCDKRNRPKGNKGAEYFKCIQCGHEENADFNASKIIARKEPSASKKNKELEVA